MVCGWLDAGMEVGVIAKILGSATGVGIADFCSVGEIGGVEPAVVIDGAVLGIAGAVLPVLVNGADDGSAIAFGIWLAELAVV